MDKVAFLNGEGTQEERDVFFLRIYARAIRERHEREVEIPSILARIFEDIAMRIEDRKTP